MSLPGPTPRTSPSSQLMASDSQVARATRTLGDAADVVDQKEVVVLIRRESRFSVAKWLLRETLRAIVG